MWSAGSWPLWTFPLGELEGFEQRGGVLLLPHHTGLLPQWPERRACVVECRNRSQKTDQTAARVLQREIGGAQMATVEAQCTGPVYLVLSSSRILSSSLRWQLCLL